MSLDVTRGSDWRLSSFCGDLSCVEVAAANGEVLMRNTSAPGLIAAFGTTGWSQFLQAVKQGEFDLS